MEVKNEHIRYQGALDFNIQFYEMFSDDEEDPLEIPVKKMHKNGTVSDEDFKIDDDVSKDNEFGQKNPENIDDDDDLDFGDKQAEDDIDENPDENMSSMTKNRTKDTKDTKDDFVEVIEGDDYTLDPDEKILEQVAARYGGSGNEGEDWLTF